MATKSNPTPASWAFSLVELLVVMAVIGILTALVVPSVNSMLRGSQLTQGSQMVNDQFGMARQLALSKNRPVEIRFYKLLDPESPGESVGNERFRAIQVFELLESGMSVAVGKVRWLPNSLLIDGGSALSTVLNQAHRPAVKGVDPIARVGIEYEYAYFRFRPDGSTDLAPATRKWFVTLHHVIDGDNLGAAPANFFGLQIDPINGHTRTYRP